MELVISNEPFNRAAALSLRQAIFVTERGIPRDIEFDDRDTSDRVYVTLYQDATHPIATLRLEPQSPTEMRFGRVCTRQDLRGQGIGTRLLTAAEDWSREHGFSTGVIHGEVSAQAFYERCGYAVNEGPFDEDGAPVVILHKDL
ncbi:GNAT family N-acetyltransferase [Levilactobacillus parabrevis]|uniref:Acetyltransferase n=2 Tax=Levilactobacillus parabrevis TaxID=357278 RepID=A0A0R1H043_9LACO|nr:GNAT family N-acetyltransferase [Levilactobacillus parabrevis]KRK37060.1 acetyltransferase [Levilactobacillus parabrevis ATCC 53295]KRO06209.1 acetyltransferase [Levilactobacillus parabrevis]MCT4490011.1 GNAT family N-acetyltransferase [Levilactobacillus parabrevis]